MMHRGSPWSQQVLVLTLILAFATVWSCGTRRALPGIDGSGADRGPSWSDGGSPVPQSSGATLRGTVCTPPRPAVLSPVKVVLLIDASQSMNTTDPGALRVKAAQQLINQWSKQPQVSFLIIAFNIGVTVNGAQAPAPAAFTNSASILASGLKSALQTTAGGDMHGAMALARKAVLADLNKTTAGDQARTRYHVVLLTDDLPYPSCGAGCVSADDFSSVICNKPRSEWCSLLKLGGNACTQQLRWFPELFPCQAYNTESTVLAEVASLKKLSAAAGVGKLQVHARFFATSTTPKWKINQVTPFLKKLSQAGGGSYKHLSTSESITFSDLDMQSLPNPYSFGMLNLIVSNMNARLHKGQLHPDTDADGLVDAEETDAAAMGALPTQRDSDGDGYSDLLERRLVHQGYHPGDPFRPQHSCSTTGRLDLEGDGLSACEEAALGSDPKLADSDADRIPDGLEHLAGTRPDLADAKLDPDHDGVDTGSEIRRHTDPLSDDKAASNLRYIYDVREVPTSTPDGRSCYEFTVKHVATAELAAGAKAATNLVMVYFGLGWSEPSDVGTYRAACVRLPHPSRSDQIITLKDAHFLTLDMLRNLMNTPGQDPCARM